MYKKGDHRLLKKL